MLIGPIVYKGLSGYIDERGEVSIPFEFDELGSFSEGVAAFARNSKVGFVNESAQIAIRPIFDRGPNLALTSCFRSGLAAVQIGSRMGYINRSGAVAIPFQFHTCSDFVREIALVQSESGYAVIHLSGSYLCDVPFMDVAEAPYEEDLIKVYPRVDGTPAPAFINRHGRIIAGPFPTFQEIHAFSSSAPNYAVAQSRESGLVGFINRDWSTQIPCSFANAAGFHEGLAAACTRDYTWGYIGPDGYWRIKPRFSDVHSFCNGTAAVKCGRGKSGKWAIIDMDGETISRELYDAAVDFDKGMRCVTIGRTTMVIDRYCNKIWQAHE